MKTKKGKQVAKLKAKPEDMKPHSDVKMDKKLIKKMVKKEALK